jgi:hypothetical protein
MRQIVSFFVDATQKDRIPPLNPPFVLPIKGE